MSRPSNELDEADQALGAAVASLGGASIHVGWRRIAAGDERALLSQERELFSRATLAQRRQSAAARCVARDLMSRMGLPQAPILKAPSGVPIWPAGLKGSLAHDDEIAVAAITDDKRISSVGIDIEPALPLPADIIDMVATASEQRIYSESLLKSRKLFVAKEATYKAVFPIDGRFLDFHDIEVDLARARAIISGRSDIKLSYAEASHLIAVAWIEVP
jgi:4'-phosphopantetheinyl transferase EntD